MTRREWLARLVQHRVNPDKFSIFGVWADSPLPTPLQAVARAAFTGSKGEIAFLKELDPTVDYTEAWRRIVLWAIPRIREDYPIEDPDAPAPFIVAPAVEQFYFARMYKSPARRASTDSMNTLAPQDIAYYVGKRTRKQRVESRQEIIDACREATENRDRLGVPAAAVELHRASV